jgi:hypothetical protein
MSTDAIIILSVFGLIVTYVFVFIWGSSKGYLLGKRDSISEMTYLKNMIETLKVDNDNIEKENEKLREEIEGRPSQW